MTTCFESRFGTPHTFGMMQAHPPSLKRARDQTDPDELLSFGISSDKRYRRAHDDADSFSTPLKHWRSTAPPVQPLASLDIAMATKERQASINHFGLPTPQTASVDVSEDVSMTEDSDTMTDSCFRKPALPQRNGNRPARLITSPFRYGSSGEDRTPTPVYGTFHYAGLPRYMSHVTSPLSPGPSPQYRSPFTLPLRRSNVEDHVMPSPIRETLLSPMGHMALTHGDARSATSNGPPSSLADGVSKSSSRPDASGRRGGNSNDEDDMDTDEQASNAAPPFAPTSPNLGRKRSGAVSMPLSEKRRFVVGYREDCEKCRMKVPGHYSHFLPVEGPC